MTTDLSKRPITIVIKVGSSILSSNANRLDERRLKTIASQVSALKKDKVNTVLVSSGAIANGMNLLNLKERPVHLAELQAAAAIGQSKLMHDYQRHFSRQKLLVAQILLTREDLHERERYLNARHTLSNLLKKNVIPIVNENDTVATEEIKFGDNDKLSALVADLINADLLIILSDVDGFYGQDNKVIGRIEQIDGVLSSMAKGTCRQTSVGGMVTKLEAAKIVNSCGIPMVIANGRTDGILLKIINEQNIGTWFLPKKDKISSKKSWLAFSRKSSGCIFVDKGAKTALLEKGKSLLASGITSVRGEFSAKSLICIFDDDNNEIARGITNYSSNELEKIKGKKTSQIKDILADKVFDEVVHRDNLAVI